MKTIELLKVSIPIWLCWHHVVHALSINSISYDVNNEIDEDSTEGKMQVIYPGTKWCGPGNISSGYDDLGEAMNADKCCREHDYCPDVIEAGKTKYNLTNNSNYSRLSCSCDQRFYDCLKENNDKTSEKVAILYFDAINTQCYKEEYPIVECKRYNRVLHWVCEEYLLDETQPKRYQWFDVPVYVPTWL